MCIHQTWMGPPLTQLDADAHDTLMKRETCQDRRGLTLAHVCSICDLGVEMNWQRSRLSPA